MEASTDITAIISADSAKLDASTSLSTVQETKRCSRCRAFMAITFQYCTTCGQSILPNRKKPSGHSEKRILRVPPMELYSQTAQATSKAKRATATSEKSKLKKKGNTSSSQGSTPFDESIYRYLNSHRPQSKEQVEKQRAAAWMKSLVLEQRNLAGFESLDRSLMTLRSKSAPRLSDHSLDQMPDISTLYAEMHRNDIVYTSYTDKNRYLHRPIHVIPGPPDADPRQQQQQQQQQSIQLSPETGSSLRSPSRPHSEPKAWLWGNPSLTDSTASMPVEIGEEGLQGSLSSATEELQPEAPTDAAPSGTASAGMNAAEAHSQDLLDTSATTAQPPHLSSEESAELSAARSLLRSEPSLEVSQLRGYYQLRASLSRGAEEGRRRRRDGREGEEYPHGVAPADPSPHNARGALADQMEASFAQHFNAHMTQAAHARHLLQDDRRQRLAEGEASDCSRDSPQGSPREAASPHPPVSSHRASDSKLATSPRGVLQASPRDAPNVLDEAMERSRQAVEDVHLVHTVHSQTVDDDDCCPSRSREGPQASEEMDDAVFFSPFHLLQQLDEGEDHGGDHVDGDSGHDPRGTPPPACPTHEDMVDRRLLPPDHSHEEVSTHRAQRLQDDVLSLQKTARVHGRWAASRDDKVRRRHRHLLAGFPPSEDGDGPGGEGLGETDRPAGRGEHAAEYEDDDWLFALIEQDERRRRGDRQCQLTTSQQWRAVEGSRAYGHTEDDDVTSEKYRRGLPPVAEGRGKTDDEREEEEEEERARASHVAVSSLYVRCHLEMKAILPDLFVDLRNPFSSLTPSHQSRLRQARDRATSILSRAERLEDRVADEVRAFLDKARALRGQSALAVARALEKSVELERFFKKQEVDLQAEQESLGEQWSVTRFRDQEERDLLHQRANEAFHACGKEIDRLQKTESEVMAKLREEEFAMMESIKAWRGKHAAMLANLIVSLRRVDKYTCE